MADSTGDAVDQSRRHPAQISGAEPEFVRLTGAKFMHLDRIHRRVRDGDGDNSEAKQN